MPVLTIASLSVRELLRRKLVAAVAILTLIAMALSAWGFWHIEASFAARGGGVGSLASNITFSVIDTLLASAFGFVLAIAAAFLGAPALASDIESGILLALLPRPLSRTEFVIGRWLALALTLVLYAAGAGAIEFAIVAAISGYVPPHPVLALAYLAWQALALLTLALFLGTRLPAIAGGICAILVFGFAWIAGIVGAIAAALDNETMVHATTVVKLIVPTDGLWRAALFELQPVAVASAASATNINPFLSQAPPPAAFLAWAAAWTIGILALAIGNFRARDL
jgi:ABC-type transport system involved in multi-copper enzyme maturation permease subunit